MYGGSHWIASESRDKSSVKSWFTYFVTHRLDSSLLKREPTLQDYSHLHEHLPRISFSSLSCNDSPAVQKYLSFRKKSIYQIANSRQHTLT